MRTIKKRRTRKFDVSYKHQNDLTIPLSQEHREFYETFYLYEGETEIDLVKNIEERIQQYKENHKNDVLNGNRRINDKAEVTYKYTELKI